MESPYKIQYRLQEVLPKYSDQFQQHLPIDHQQEFNSILDSIGWSPPELVNFHFQRLQEFMHELDLPLHIMDQLHVLWVQVMDVVRGGL